MYERAFNKYFVSEQELKEIIRAALEGLNIFVPEKWSEELIDYADPNKTSEAIIYDLLINIPEIAELRELFAEFQSDWAKDVCILVLNTGLRQNDALGLSKFNIDWSSNVIRLTQGKTKKL